jgi:hypothetical protein
MIVRDTTWGIRSYISGFEGSQAVSGCHFGIGRTYDRIFYLFLFIFMNLEEVHYSNMLANVGRAILGRNFDVTNGRAACEACSVT